MSPKITVYLAVYNGANFIECAVNSVLRQTYKDISLFISDNDSTDDTRLIVNKYLNDKRVTLFKQPYNIGLTNNGNFCLERITTEYFTGLCHDDFLYNDRALETALSILEKHPEVSVVYCNTIFVDANDKQITRRKAGFSGIIENDLVARRSIVCGRNLYGAPLLSRTSSLQGFRCSDDFYHTGDIDLCMWLGRGRKVYYIPETLFALRFHDTNSTARVYNRLDEEFMRLAAKYGIKLSSTERALMKANHWVNYVKKNIFYFYLDRIRR